MEIQHRINFTSEANVEAALDALGIRCTKTPLFHRYLIHVDIKESHPAWPAVAALAAEKNAGDLYHTEFSHQEISEAEWSVLAQNFFQGYPRKRQPMRTSVPSAAAIRRKAFTSARNPG